ncbi:MBL fold metallo-hydrolase [Streptomyces sp. NPDC050549]|uniref:MBL fold metallo-hydrolase n=1 Tax=Streptomyces sp. NPDC050549 TaxID=3155406 RepID=UPI0034479FAB
MDVVEILPRLHLLRFPVGQACPWYDDRELTLIDAGPVGSGASIAAGITSLGRDPGAAGRIVLTQFHEDHMGGAAEFATLGGAEVLTHRLAAPVVRGEVPGPPPVFEDWERPIHAEAVGRLPPGDVQHPGLVTELDDGNILDFGGGAHVVHSPGHTDGSIALHLPEHGVLFTGDAVASSPIDGEVTLGVFNVDRAQAIASFHRPAALDPDVACFGHGDPVIGGAGAALRRSTDKHTAPRRG